MSTWVPRFGRKVTFPGSETSAAPAGGAPAAPPASAPSQTPPPAGAAPAAAAPAPARTPTVEELAAADPAIAALIARAKQAEELQHQVAELQLGMKEAEERAGRAEERAGRAEQRTEKLVQELEAALERIREQERALAQAAAAGTSTVRDLIAGHALSADCLHPTLEEGDRLPEMEVEAGMAVRNPSGGSLKRGMPTDVAPDWVPFSKERSRLWTKEDFARHLETADAVTVRINGNDVGVLDLVMRGTPDARTATKLRGEYLATENTRGVLEENLVEALLLKAVWDPLEVAMGGDHVTTRIAPGGSRLVAVDRQYRSLFRPDDTIDVRLGAPLDLNRALADASGESGVEGVRGDQSDETAVNSALQSVGCVTIEVKVPHNCPVPLYATDDAKNRVIRGSLFEYATSEETAKLAENFNPLAQISTYLLLLRMVFGAVTTLNHTTFVRVDCTAEDWEVFVTEKLDATNAAPLAPHKDWSYFEVWIRYCVASIGKSRVRLVPEPIQSKFRKLAERRRDSGTPKRSRSKGGDEDEDYDDGSGGGGGGSGAGGGSGSGGGRRGSRAGGSTSRASGARGAGSGAAKGGGSGGGPIGAAFALSYADLFDARRFAPPEEGVPPEIQFAPGKLEDDAALIHVGRVGRVFRKTIRGVDCVVKMLARYCKRDELDGVRNVLPTHISAELDREEDAYERLGALQGRFVPRFLLHGVAAGGLAELFATEYAGEPFPARDVPDVAAENARTALRAVHECGVLHGDVSLANLAWLPDTCAVVVLDFGLCAFREEFESDEEWREAAAEEMASLEELLREVVAGGDGATETEAAQAVQAESTDAVEVVSPSSAGDAHMPALVGGGEFSSNESDSTLFGDAEAPVVTSASSPHEGETADKLVENGRSTGAVKRTRGLVREGAAV